MLSQCYRRLREDRVGVRGNKCLALASGEERRGKERKGGEEGWSSFGQMMGQGVP